VRPPRDLVDGHTAEDAAAALRLLPHYVAERSTVTRVEQVPIP